MSAASSVKAVSEFTMIQLETVYNLVCLCSVCRPANMIAQSQSGTGKTAAFVLTMLSRVVVDNAWPQVSMGTVQAFRAPLGLWVIFLGFSFDVV